MADVDFEDLLLPQHPASPQPGFTGPGPRMNGPGPRMNGPGMNGPGMNLNGPGPGMRLNGPGPGGMMLNGPGAGVMSGGGLMIQGGGMNGPGMMQGSSMNMGGSIAGIPMGSAQDAPEIGEGLECAKCAAVISGPVVQAMGKSYHPDHFVCEYCSQPFPGGRFVKAPDGNLYCEQDFAELFAKRCQVCNEVIRGKAVNAESMSFHTEHFICVGCGTNLVGKRYKVHPQNKQIYCPTCLPPEERVLRPESHICSQCNKPIVGPYLLIQGQFMHPRHYRCHECGTEFKGGDCQQFEGDFYCNPHYEILILKKCARCGKPCKGRSITALGKIWHPDHFTCHICSAVFVESHFYENDGLPYCETHYVQLFGDNCAHCKEPIVKGAVKFLEKSYHPEHFFCSVCQKPLKKEFTSWDDKPICTGCYGKLPAKLRKQVQQRLKEEKRAKLKRMKEEKKA